MKSENTQIVMKACQSFIKNGVFILVVIAVCTLQSCREKAPLVEVIGQHDSTCVNDSISTVEYYQKPQKDHIYVSIELSGVQIDDVFIDTGGDCVQLCYEDYIKLKKASKLPAKSIQRRKIIGCTGDTVLAEEYLMPELDLGNLRFRNVNVLFTVSNRTIRYRMLGMSVLNRLKSFTVSPEQRTISLCKK